MLNYLQYFNMDDTVLISAELLIDLAEGAACYNSLLRDYQTIPYENHPDHDALFYLADVLGRAKDQAKEIVSQALKEKRITDPPTDNPAPDANDHEATAA